MKQSLLTKLDSLSDRHEELGALLSDAEVIADQDRFRDLSREYSELETVVRCFASYRQATTLENLQTLCLRCHKLKTYGN